MFRRIHFQSPWLSVFLITATALPTLAADRRPAKNDGDATVAKYFRQETRRITEQTFAGIETLDDWTSRREEYQRQMREMLGLDPMPEKTPLQPVVTGQLERDGVIAEKLHFQSMPGLYVTANLYRPSDQEGPLPAVLYVCGHAYVKPDGISLGNKTAYQHHGGWFARNGYVCLTIDTVQLGEIEGIHHGTYREDMWWWNNRGYSSAAVEAYNGIRALDYLQSREEVDGQRIGITGRSGGGAYSWWVAALDERIRAAVPVAGITSLKNHVVDGCVEGHCDCMYMVNTYRWDFPMVAALVAPRPLLITNSDKDRIFPLDGVVDVHRRVRKIYDLYDASDKLGLQISEGPHKDTQELRVAAFRWMNRFLRDDDSLLDIPAEPLFERAELKVLDQLPKDERTSTIHETFVPKVEAGAATIETDQDAGQLISTLRRKTFGGWPEEPEPLEVNVHQGASTKSDTAVIEFTSQSPFRLSALWIRGDDSSDPKATRVVVLDEQALQRWTPALAGIFPEQFPQTESDPKAAARLRSSDGDQVFMMPRGVGPAAWSNDKRTQTHIRRRFMLLGQTLAGMQIYDVVRSLQAIGEVDALAASPIRLEAKGDAAVWAVHAALQRKPGGVEISELNVSDLPQRNRDAPDLLNVSRFVELPDLVKLARQRVGR